MSVKYTFAGQIMTFGASLHNFGEGFFGFLFNLDLFHPGHVGYLFLLIFLGMGIRPSYIGEKKQRKVDMLYDLANIKSHIFQKPLYLIILLLLSYVFFYISFLFNQNWHMLIFSVFGWLSIIAIVSLIIAHLLVFLIKTTDEIPNPWKYMPYINLPLSYILIRLLFYFYPVDFDKTASLLIMIFSTIIITFVLLYYKTNKFKTKLEMKPMRIADGPRRIIKK